MFTVMDSGALYRLMAWLSPSYPVGAFSYSHGLERLVETGAISDRESLVQWLGDLLLLGGGRNDAILFSASYYAAQANDIGTLHEIAECASAFAASAERVQETQAQGKAFADITCRTWSCTVLDLMRKPGCPILCYPVAVGIAASDHGLPLEAALVAYLHAWTANLVSAGIRLVPLGHSDGQLALRDLKPAVGKTAVAGLVGDLGQLSGATVIADLASMQHETQHTRLFRT